MTDQQLRKITDHSHLSEAEIIQAIRDGRAARALADKSIAAMGEPIDKATKREMYAANHDALIVARHRLMAQAFYRAGGRVYATPTAMIGLTAAESEAIRHLHGDDFTAAGRIIFGHKWGSDQ